MEKRVELIPEGHYCYTINSVDNKTGRLNIDVCPYWDKNEDHPEQDNGYCHFLEEGDWEMEGLGLLWDQCKECGENFGDEEFVGEF